MTKFYTMKELESYLNNDERYNKHELSIKKKQEIEYVLQGTIKPKKGHFIWEINEETGEINKAEFKKTTAVFGAKMPPQELVVKPDCVYIPALNAENAKKKYLQNKEQSAYYVKPPAMSMEDILWTKRNMYKP